MGGWEVAYIPKSGIANDGAGVIACCCKGCAVSVKFVDRSSPTKDCLLGCGCPPAVPPCAVVASRCDCCTAERHCRGGADGVMMASGLAHMFSVAT
eukprot:6471900-Amphidinium_carterae.1